MAAPNGYIVSIHELDLTPLGERHLRLPIRIGRSSLNDVAVAHRLVSEFHARLEEVDGKLCVRDLGSTNGVLVEAFGGNGATRVPAHQAVDLEPYGYEFLLSPELRARVRPATTAAAFGRQSHAVGSVLGNAGGAICRGAPFAENQRTEAFVPLRGLGGARLDIAPPPLLHGSPSPPPPPPLPRVASGRGAPPASASEAVQPYASVFIEPTSAPLELPPLPCSAPRLDPVPAMPEARHPRLMAEPRDRTRLSPAPREQRAATVLEQAPLQPARSPATAWEASEGGTLPGAAQTQAAADALAYPSLEALALRGLRELAASLVPGQPVESPGDVIQLVTKLHDALDMFCRCFVPLREACSRFIDPDELERAAAARCHARSPSYVAVERALEPRAVAGALLDWRDDAQDAPSAVEHILADLVQRQLALLEGALDGTRALLRELSPRHLESREPPDASILSRLAGSRERALWEAFSERHAELAQAGEEFRGLFGELFRRAYLAKRAGYR